MARQVTASTGNFLKVRTGTALTFPYTLAVWVKHTPGGSTGLRVVYGQVYGDIAWDMDAIAGIGAQSASGASFASANSPVTEVEGTWYLVIAVVPASDYRQVYVNNSTQTGFDGTALPARVEPSKYITAGGIILDVSLNLHPAILWDGEVADIALWDVAFNPAEVDALAAGRPGDVLPANLKAWYKLGEDGDLTSSVGAYPALTVIGSCPITDDPPYAGAAAPGTLKTINAIPMASVKSFLNIPKASIKTINALTIGGAAEPEFSPADIAGLQAWYKADEGVYSRSAAQFVSANSEYLSVPSNTSLRMGAGVSWSVGGWIYVESAAALQIPLSKDAGGNVDFQIYIFNDEIAMNGSTIPGAATPVSAGAWVLGIASFDSSTGQGSIQVNNGTPVFGGVSGSTTDSATGFLNLGSNGTPTYFFGGRLQNWLMFGRLLNSAERTFLYNAGAGRSYEELDATFKTDLRAWWPLDEVSGSRRDLSGNGNTLTDNNTVGEADGVVLNPAGNATKIYQWSDLSGNGRHFLQGTVAARPVYLTNVRNGLPVTQFYGSHNGQSQYMAQMGSMTTGAIFNAMVCQAPTPFGDFYGWISAGSTWYLIVYQGQNYWLIGGSALGGLKRDGVDGMTVLTTDQWVNWLTYGVPVVGTDLLIGVDRYIGSRHWFGQTGEIVIYDALPSAGDEALLNDYLRGRWDLP